VVLVGALVTSFALCAQIQAGDRETALDAWQRRQDGIVTAFVEWTEERSEVGGSLGRMDPSVTPGASPELSWNTECELTLSGNKFRVEFDGPAWYTNLGGLRDHRRLGSFDGSESRSFSDSSDANMDSSGSISGSENTGLTGVENRPLLWYLRPLQPSLSTFQRPLVTAAGRPAQKDGRDCLVLTAKDGGNLTWELWVDPTLGYQIVRGHFLDRNGGEYLVDLNYADEADGARKLAGWTMQSLKLGVLQRFRTCTVTRMDLNPTVDESKLPVVFPVGVRVRDLRDKTEYIVRADEGQRPILSYERSLPNAVLAGSEPGEAAAPTTHTWKWLTAALALLFVAGYLVYRARSKSA
jgi:hypothetical protein